MVFFCQKYFGDVLKKNHVSRYCDFANVKFKRLVMNLKEEIKSSKKISGLSKEDIEGLHYIVALDAELLESIFVEGLLSRNRVKEITKNSVDISSLAVQERRAKKKVNKIPLHDYVNLYLNANNAMMYSLTQGEISKANEFCVLHVKPNILSLKNVMMSSRNAASREAKFFSAQKTGVLYPQSSAECLSRQNYVESDSSSSSDAASDEAMEDLRKIEKSIRQAEVLVPHRVSPSYIDAIFVASEQSKLAVENGLNAIKERWLVKGSLRENSPLNKVTVVVKPSIFFVRPEKYVNLEKSESLPPSSAARKRKLDTDTSESSDSKAEEKGKKAKIQTKPNVSPYGVKAERSNSEAEVGENKRQGVRLPLVRALSRPSTSPKRIKAERSRSVESKEASFRGSQFDDALPPKIPRDTYSSLMPLMNNASGGGGEIASSSGKKETKSQQKVTVPTTKRAKKFLAAARNNMQITQFFTSSEPTPAPPMSGSLVGNNSMSLSRSSGGGPASSIN